MTKPFVSIIIPVFNAENYLNRCIRSVLSQSFNNFELILVDDGSTDRSSDICDGYEVEDERIHVIHQANAGVSAARNRGIESAKGEYISFIDADDWVERDMYESLFNEARENGADYVYCDYYQEKGGCSIVQKTVNCVPNDCNATIQNHISTWFVSAWMSIIRRDIIIANHIRFNTDLAYNEDFNFIAKYLVFAHRISKVDRALYHYDESNMSSALHQKNSRQSKDEYHSQVDVMKFYSRHNFYEMCKKPLNHRVVRCLYFYRNPQIYRMNKSIISFFDIVTCPHIGIRGKFYVAFRLFFPYTLSSIIHDP